MNDDRKEIEEIKQKLKQLSQKRLGLSKAHQQQFFLYRWLQRPDPEIECINSEITRLEEQKSDIYKIILVITTAQE